MKTRALALPKLSKQAKRNMKLVAGAGIVGLGSIDLIRLATSQELRDKLRESGDLLQLKVFGDVIAILIGSIILIG